MRGAFYGWMLGFSQCVIAIVTEFIVILYLNSLSNLMDIIMKFVSMAAIVRFDDFYASALYEEKMKGAVGKRPPIEYKRKMNKLYKDAVKASRSNDFTAFDDNE